MSTKFKVIGLTRLGVKPESTALEVEAPTTRLPQLLNVATIDAKCIAIVIVTTEIRRGFERRFSFKIVLRLTLDRDIKSKLKLLMTWASLSRISLTKPAQKEITKF